MRRFAPLVLLALLPPFLSAARLTLRDGSVLYGQFISGTAETVVFQDDNGVRRRFDLRQVLNIDFGDFTPQATSHNLVPDGTRSGDNEADRMDPRSGNEWAVVPAGGSISVETENEITPRNSGEGRSYPALILQDVLDASGHVLIPKGAPATLVVRRVSAGTTLSSPNYVLDLDSVRIGGRRYVVNTSDVPAGYESAEPALGTLLDALGGGERVEVWTTGHQIRVPAQTVLNFRLEAPLRLREAR